MTRTTRVTGRTPVVVLLSGGMDSTALAASVAESGTPWHAVSVDYGQRHRRELDSARAVAEHYGVPHTVIDLSALTQLVFGGSALTGAGEVPEGHYAAETMAATVVPNRNAIFLNLAVGYAVAHGCDTVLTAVHAGDHPIYADCRPEFIDAANAAAQAGTDNLVSIEAPFVRIGKDDIAAIGEHCRAPFVLTWSCYAGGETHCGRCGTCVERAEAFHLAGVPDPTEYADPTFWRTATGVTA